MPVTNKEYLQPQELPTYYDVRRLKQLLSDTGLEIDEADLSNTASDSYTLVAKLIRGVAATIDSRCQQGRRYSTSDLEGMAYAARTSNSLTDTEYEAKWKRFSLLQQLTADILFGSIVARRGYSADSMKQLAPRYEDALFKLEQLYNGIAIFDLDEPKNAGVPKIVNLGQRRIMSSDFNRMFGVWPSGTNSSYGLFGGRNN